MNKRYWTEEDLAFLINNYPEHGNEYCRQFMDRSAKSIKDKASKLGLKLKGDFYHYKKRDFSEIFNLNNPKVVYLLGLMWADGTVGKSSVALTMISEDLGPLLDQLNIRDLLVGCSIKNLKARINTRTDKTSFKMTESKPQTVLSFGNKDIVTFLRENGYVASRTDEAKIVQLIPEQLRPYWFRGLFDGDGCYYINETKNRFCISLSSNIASNCSYMYDLKDKLGLRMSCNAKKNTLCQSFEMTGIDNTHKFIDYVYNKNLIEDIGLPRKKDKAARISDLKYKVQPQSLESALH